MKSHVTLMTECRPVRLIVLFALPLMFGNIFQQLYSVVDSMIVGKTLGVAALAALGASSWPNWIIVGMIMGLTQGISILLARSFGKGDETGLFIAMVAAWGGALVVLIFSYFYTVRKTERKYIPSSGGKLCRVG